MRPRLVLAWQLGMSGTIGPLVADSTLVMRQIGAVGVGLTAEYSLTPALGVEAAVAWTPSSVDWRHTFDRSAAVWLGSIRVRILTARSPKCGLILTAGPGIVERKGSAWRGMTGMRRPALVTGLNLWFRTRSPFSYGFELQDYLSRARYFDASGYQFGPRIHNDILVTFSVRYAAL